MTAHDLTKSLKNFTAGMEPDALAKYIAPKLREAAEEVERAGRRLNATEAEKQLASYYAEVIMMSCDLLQTLEQEQWRQREAIRLHLHSRIDRSSLRAIAYSWNWKPEKDDA